MRSGLWAVIVCAVGLSGCGSPDSKPPAGAESSDTKLDIELDGGDAKPTDDTPTSDAPTSDAPTSDAPTSDAPTSDAPTSDAPTASETPKP